MTEKKKRGRPKKVKDAEVVPDNGPMMVNPDNPPPQEECGPITVAYKPQSITQGVMRKLMTPSDGKLVITDPINAASLARHPKNASVKDEVPFPDNWDKLGKIEKLQWLTAHRK